MLEGSPWHLESSHVGGTRLLQVSRWGHCRCQLKKANDRPCDLQGARGIYDSNFNPVIAFEREASCLAANSEGIITRACHYQHKSTRIGEKPHLADILLYTSRFEEVVEPVLFGMRSMLQCSALDRTKPTVKAHQKTRELCLRLICPSTRRRHRDNPQCGPTQSKHREHSGRSGRQAERPCQSLTSETMLQYASSPESSSQGCLYAPMSYEVQST